MAHLEMETVKILSDEDPDNFFYNKNRCRDRLNSVTPKAGLSDRQYEDSILQCLPPKYYRTRQTYFEREDCSLSDIRRMMPHIYADKLARSNSDFKRGIAGRGVAIQVRGPTSATQKGHYCNGLGPHKNDCADFKAVRQQN